MSEIDQKRPLRRDFPVSFELTAETIIDSEYEYQKAVYKLRVRETRLSEKENRTRQTLGTRTEKIRGRVTTLASAGTLQGTVGSTRSEKREIRTTMR